MKQRKEKVSPKLCLPPFYCQSPKPSPTDRFPLVPASLTTTISYNDFNAMPSLVPDMEGRSLPRFQLPVNSNGLMVGSHRRS
ncbi:hypothetical protein TNCV_4830361 [Trichonephila clavipes]|nr:hypothetical protein TNCV_4830361 [Trichonephila clavipes]